MLKQDKEAIKFVKEKIEELLDLFPSAQCRYEVDLSDNTHSVEVAPEKIYESKEFEEAEIGLWVQFYQKFPNHGLYFISQNCMFPVKNPIYTKAGRNFLVKE